MKLLTQNDYRVLREVLRYGSLSKNKAISIKQMQPLVNLSYTKVNTAFKGLVEHGFVDMGIPNGRERTFYITENGINELNNLSIPVVDIKRGGNLSE